MLCPLPGSKEVPLLWAPLPRGSHVSIHTLTLPPHLSPSPIGGNPPSCTSLGHSTSDPVSLSTYDSANSLQFCHLPVSNLRVQTIFPLRPQLTEHTKHHGVSGVTHLHLGLECIDAGPSRKAAPIAAIMSLRMVFKRALLVSGAEDSMSL